MLVRLEAGAGFVLPRYLGIANGVEEVADGWVEFWAPRHRGKHSDESIGVASGAS